MSVSRHTLISLTEMLYSKHVIDRPTKISVISKGGYEGADALLDHVEMKVESKPRILPTVLEAMKEHELFRVRVPLWLGFNQYQSDLGLDTD